MNDIISPSLTLPDVNRSISPPNEVITKKEDQTKVKLKRLKFINKSLEVHNSHKYLELSREEAQQEK